MSPFSYRHTVRNGFARLELYRQAAPRRPPATSRARPTTHHLPHAIDAFSRP
jgi:hypothetical protein